MQRRKDFPGLTSGLNNRSPIAIVWREMLAAYQEIDR